MQNVQAGENAPPLAGSGYAEFSAVKFAFFIDLSYLTEYSIFNPNKGKL